jgi:hypothetical protein
MVFNVKASPATPSAEAGNLGGGLRIRLLGELQCLEQLYGACPFEK